MTSSSTSISGRARRDTTRSVPAAGLTGSPPRYSADYPAFLDRMTQVLAELLRVLRDGRYAVPIVRDAYQDGRYLFTASDLAGRATTVGFTVKGDVIWHQAGARLRPYGYPKVFVPNIVHEHIVVLRKEPAPLGPQPLGRRPGTVSR